MGKITIVSCVYPLVPATDTNVPCNTLFVAVTMCTATVVHGGKHGHRSKLWEQDSLVRARADYRSEGGGGAGGPHAVFSRPSSPWSPAPRSSPPRSSAPWAPSAATVHTRISGLGHMHAGAVGARGGATDQWGRERASEPGDGVGVGSGTRVGVEGGVGVRVGLGLES